MKIAYHTGEYPRATDTFIQREIDGLRTQGADVITCSVRRTDSSHHVGTEQQTESRNTFYVQEAAKNPIRLLKAHARMLRKAPRRYFSVAKLAVRTSPPGLKNALYQVFYFLEAGVLADHLIDQRVDHLHNHFANSSCSVAMLASTMANIPYSVTMHGPAIFFEPKKWRIDEKIANAQFVSCISHYCRSQAMIFADQSHWDRLHIVHCGVDPSRYGHEERGDENTNLLFVGRLAAVKGLPIILEAVAQLKQDHPGVRLTIVGDGPDRAALEAKARSLDLSAHVSFVGYKSQDEVAQYLQHTDIFVLPSFAEGVPVVLMEALASGVPVLTTRIAGVGELVEDEVSGYTVPPGDLEGLIVRLCDLLESPSLRKRMGEAGRKKVEKDFDISRESSWLYDIMQAYHRGEEDQIGLRPRPRL
ncbi:MAG: glycosyltransferase family 4 protein [Parvularcula sp.]